MKVLDRTRKVDEIVASASGSPEEHGLVLNLLVRLERQDQMDFRELMESLWGSDTNAERYNALNATLQNVRELGLVEEPNTAVFQLTELGARYMDRDIRYYELDGQSKHLSHWIARPVGEVSWKFLNWLEGQVDPFTYREPVSDEIKDEFSSAFEQRFRLYFPLILVALAGIISVDQLFQIHNQSYGLVLDIEGTIIIAIGLVRGHHGIGTESSSDLVDWERAFGTTHSLNDLIIESYKTVDAIWGSTLLILGFLIQIIALSLA